MTDLLLSGMLSSDETAWSLDHANWFPAPSRWSGPGVRLPRRRSSMGQATASKPYAPFPPGSPLIRVEHLTRFITTRAQRTVILNDVNFTIPAQRLFAINGPSGSGKSTLLNLLTGIDRPSSGRIIFGAEKVSESPENALARWRGAHVGI